MNRQGRQPTAAGTVTKYPGERRAQLQWENLRLAEGESLGERAKGVKNWIADSCSHSLGGERREKIQSSAEAARCTLRSPKKVLGPRVTHKEHSERLKLNKMS